MNDIISAKNYSLHKHRFYAIQKIKYKNLYLIYITTTYSKARFAHFLSNILLYLDIQK